MNQKRSLERKKSSEPRKKSSEPRRRAEKKRGSDRKRGSSKEKSSRSDERSPEAPPLDLVKFPSILRKHQQASKRAGKSIRLEFQNIIRKEPTFRNFLKQPNIAKNRFPNVVLYDHTRITLDPNDRIAKSDYIHASYVDGFRQEKAYILTQAPKLETISDFWRMVWSTKAKVIVLLSKVAGDPSTAQKKDVIDFWPGTGKVDKLDQRHNFRLETLTSTQGPGYDSYKIEFQKGESRHKVNLLQYHRWRTDDEIPEDLPLFIAHARMAANRTAPMIVCCCNGVSRSGTFVTLDISLRRLQKTKEVDLLETCRAVRSQRYGCIHSLHHYLFLNRAVLDHAAAHGLLDEEDIDLPTFYAATVISEQRKALR